MRSLGRSIKKFSADDMLVYAAALSYQLFFSVFPFVIFLLALLGVLNLTTFFDWLLKQSQTVLPGQASEMVQDVIEQIRGNAASGALSLGAVLALWSASSAVRMAMRALNVVLLMLVGALVYYLFPNTSQPFRVVTPGAVLAVVVWVLASLGFSWYVANFASYNATYGALAAVIVLLFYFFISAAIMLFGAELNSEVYRQAVEGGEEEYEPTTSEGS
jgi:uncharacterized BrkB/YihY/UPF0761 family membrane protein